MAHIGKLGRPSGTATEELVPPDMAQRIDELLATRLSRLQLPPDIKPLYVRRIRSNVRRTTTAYCFWIGSFICIDTIFDFFMVSHAIIQIVVAMRIVLTAAFYTAGGLFKRDKFTGLAPFYIGVPIALSIVCAGVSGELSHDPELLTTYIYDAMIVVVTGIVFVGMEISFCLTLCAVCIPLIALFVINSNINPFGARLQITCFISSAILAVSYGRHVQNLILTRLFLLNMRDEIRDSQARARNAQLSSIAYTDPLTEISNRRYFDEICATITDDTPSLLPISICLIDIDHFKKLNDTLGHLQGDRCLKLVAATLRNNLRSPADIVARFGGEEFVLLLQNADLNTAYEVAERIRGAIIDLEHPNPGAPGGMVTVSVGVADLQKPPVVIQTLINQADQALYRAKLTGRNRVST